MRHRYDLFGDEAFAASAEFDDDGFEYWWWGDWKHDTPYDGSAEKVFGAAARQLYEEFFASSFDQIMAAIDIVHSLNPHLDFSRERLAAFFIHLRDLASGELSSGLFGSTATEVLRLTELKDEWASLSWWDISSQLRVGIEMGRLLVKVRLNTIAPGIAETKPFFLATFADLRQHTCFRQDAGDHRRARYSRFLAVSSATHCFLGPRHCPRRSARQPHYNKCTQRLCRQSALNPLQYPFLAFARLIVHNSIPLSLLLMLDDLRYSSSF